MPPFCLQLLDWNQPIADFITQPWDIYRLDNYSNLP